MAHMAISAVATGPNGLKDADVEEGSSRSGGTSTYMSGRGFVRPGSPDLS